MKIAERRKRFHDLLSSQVPCILRNITAQTVAFWPWQGIPTLYNIFGIHGLYQCMRCCHGSMLVLVVVVMGSGSLALLKTDTRIRLSVSYDTSVTGYRAGGLQSATHASHHQQHSVSTTRQFGILSIRSYYHSTHTQSSFLKIGPVDS